MYIYTFCLLEWKNERTDTDLILRNFPFVMFRYTIITKKYTNFTKKYTSLLRM